MSVPPILSVAAAQIETRLATLGLALPTPSVPRGSYVPWVRSGALVFVAGQGPRLDGRLLHAGQVGIDLDLEQARDAARLCALNLVAQLRSACQGDLGRVTQVVRLAGVVNAAIGFSDHAKVLDGASDLMHQLFQERGLHVRMATGASSLPSNMAVEIEAVFEIA
ncbi:RidA family protein [Herbaspirillum sp. alder98]|uniref:RidA family protein n=1 Tax=Herbaspirillum sp. alder98 TaxID=2913096 RepID=UPI001CD8A5FB|nr:RidA family protein [Herbaspirillum sp. alder98]MCA1326746.1 RidA family protein [Herbaspirillum sp. alder98]